MTHFLTCQLLSTTTKAQVRVMTKCSPLVRMSTAPNIVNNIQHHSGQNSTVAWHPIHHPKYLFPAPLTNHGWNKYLLQRLLQGTCLGYFDSISQSCMLYQQKLKVNRHMGDQPLNTALKISHCPDLEMYHCSFLIGKCKPWNSLPAAFCEHLTQNKYNGSNRCLKCTLSRSFRGWR